MSKKQPEPNNSSSQTDYTFEEAMKIIATTDKKVVDERIANAQKKQRKNKVKR